MNENGWDKAKKLAEQHESDDRPTPAERPEEFIRLPGLFRRWEFQEVIEAGKDFHIEDAGIAADGTPLFQVFRREPTRLEDPQPRGEM